MSTRRKSRSNRTNRRTVRDSTHGGMGMTLNKLLESSKRQELSAMPGVPDVQRMIYRPDRVFNFVDTLSLGNLSPTTGAPVLGAYAFQLFNVADFTHYQALFDQFRFVQVEVLFTPRGQLAPAQQSSLLTVIDYDDNTTPTSIQQLYGYDTLQISPATVQISRVFRPRAPLELQLASGDAIGLTSNAQWVDVESGAQVNYYGLKFGLNAVATSPGGPQFDVYAKIHMQFRSQR